MGVTAEYGLGIDLGTTQTAAAVLAGGRLETARLGARRAEIPSAVFVRNDGGLLLGEAAERRGLEEPGRLAREFKRRMGDPVPILAGGVPFSAHALTAKLLRHVLDTVTRLQDGPPAALALTYPANWGPYKREQLDQAIRLADAGPVRLLTEPEAAARQHAIARRIAPGETVAVYDLGGGTFDVAVLRREGDGFVLLGTPEGIEQLGGADFDEAVFAHVLGALDGGLDGLDPNDPEAVLALARLRRDCVEAKESLSFDTEATIPVALPGRHTRVRLNRSEFEAMIAPSVQDTVDATRRALRSAGVEAGALSAILLAGGSSRIPLVAQVLAEEFERPVVADPHPEYSVALGAASTTAADLPSAAAPTPASVAKENSADSTAGTPGAAAASAANGSTTNPETEPTATELAATGYATGASPTGFGADASPTGFATGASPTGPATTVPNGAAPNRATPGGAGPSGAGPSSAGPSGAGPSRAVPSGPASPANNGRIPTPATPPATRANQDSTDLRTPADPWAAAEAAEAEAAAAHAAAAAAAGHAPADHADVVPAGHDPAGYAPTELATAGHPPDPEPDGATIAIPFPRIAPAQPTRLDEFAGLGPTGPGGPPPGAYQIGAASIPEPPEPSARFGSVTYPPKPAPARSRRTLVIAAIVAFVVLAGAGTAIGLFLARGNKKPPAAIAPSPSVSSAPALTSLPSAPMLVTEHTPGKAVIDVFTPGTAIRRPLTGTVNGDTLPRWSHDRTKIALTHNTAGSTTAQIFVMNANGSGRHEVLSGVTTGKVAWSADGTQLAYLKPEGGVPQLFVSLADGKSAKQLTKASGLKDDPVWTPDGTKILYWATVGGVRSIFAMDVADPQEPGTQITETSFGDAIDPAVSPDGKQVLFARPIKPDNSDIYLVNIDGSDVRPIIQDSAREQDPSWSPDGKWFAYGKGEYVSETIEARRIDGSKPTLLTPKGGREAQPCWF